MMHAIMMHAIMMHAISPSLQYTSWVPTLPGLEHNPTPQQPSLILPGPQNLMQITHTPGHTALGKPLAPDPSRGPGPSQAL
jgi:hypothetical protein